MPRIPKRKANNLLNIKGPATKHQPTKKKLLTKNRKKVTPKEELVSKKRTLRKVIKKSVTKKEVRTKKIAQNQKKESVDLPKNMTLSSVNKSLALRRELDAYIKRSVYIVTYVAAICFVLVGSTVAFSEIFGNKYSKDLLKAEITKSIESTDSQVYETSYIDIIDVIPDSITEDYRVNFIAKNVSSVQAKMTPLGGGDAFRLDVQKLIEDRYKTILKNSVPSRYYTLDILYQPLNQNSPKVAQSKQFFVGTKEQEYAFNNPEKVLEKTLETSESVSSEDTIVESTSASSSENAEPEQELKKTDETTSPTLTDGDEIIRASEITKEEYIGSPSLDFRIEFPESSELVGTASLKLHAPVDFVNILLYAKPINSRTPLFVTSARSINGSWVFVFDTRNLPNNDYEFFARTTFKNEVLRTSSQKLRIFNRVIIPVDEIKDADLITIQSLDTNIEEITPKAETDSEVVPITLSRTTSEREFNNIVSFEDEVGRIARDLINKNLTDFQELFRGYAVALQSEDEVLIRVAIENLTKKTEIIIVETSNIENLRFISNDLNKEMIRLIDYYKNRIETFEEIRLLRSSINGFDGEIQELDPNSSEFKTPMVFQSPKETIFLEQEEFLKVEEVLPVVGRNGDSAIVRAEIRGTALPNSFATLYIFSTPTVVTIKTGADGSFVYTFDKELEDGEHVVYVAITDNTGAIIVQSRPFSFIKQAEAFEPIGSKESVLVLTTESTVTTSYNLVIGLAVLSLGIILLMLGISLRPKNESENNSIFSDDENNIPDADASSELDKVDKGDLKEL